MVISFAMVKFPDDTSYILNEQELSWMMDDFVH